MREHVQFIYLSNWQWWLWGFFLLCRHWPFKRASALGTSLLVHSHQLPETRTSQRSTNQWHQRPPRNKCQPPTRWQHLSMKLSSCPFWWPLLCIRNWSKSKTQSKTESLHPSIEWSLVSMVILMRWGSCQRIHRILKVLYDPSKIDWHADTWYIIYSKLDLLKRSSIE